MSDWGAVYICNIPEAARSNVLVRGPMPQSDKSRRTPRPAISSTITSKSLLSQVDWHLFAT